MFSFIPARKYGTIPHMELFATYAEGHHWPIHLPSNIVYDSVIHFRKNPGAITPPTYIVWDNVVDFVCSKLGSTHTEPLEEWLGDSSDGVVQGADGNNSLF